MLDKMTRREFLLALAGLTAATAVQCLPAPSTPPTSIAPATGTPVSPTVADIPKAPPPPSPTVAPSLTPSVARQRFQVVGRVVHVHSNAVTSWIPNADPAYWCGVNENVVAQMIDRGMSELTGKATAADAWRTLLPNYQPGQKIAIKVSFNNQGDCSSNSGAIDSVIEPVNVIARRLAEIGVALDDVWVYDAMRPIPDRFAKRGVPGVRYFDRPGGCRTPVVFGNTRVTFAPPAGVSMPAEEKIPDVLVNATYLINLPIMKQHACSGVSLAFKNHFGTIHQPGGLHPYVFLLGQGCGQDGGYTESYNPLVDLYRSPHIGPKTILTIGEGLFAALGKEDNPPVAWKTFGNQVPKSLFFATDPVAVDSVMGDLLRAENNRLRAESFNYLRLASAAGLGIYEQGDPWKSNGSGYNRIEYRRFEI